MRCKCRCDVHVEICGTTAWQPGSFCVQKDPAMAKIGVTDWGVFKKICLLCCLHMTWPDSGVVTMNPNSVTVWGVFLQGDVSCVHAGVCTMKLCGATWQWCALTLERHGYLRGVECCVRNSRAVAELLDQLCEFYSLIHGSECPLELC